MVKKKGKKKKSKKKAEAPDPSTGGDLEIEGDGAQLGIGKKKKKKVKLTKEEKAAAKLAKMLENFVTDSAAYEKFLQKLDVWMMVNTGDVESLFKRFDEEGDGIVPVQVFKAGLKDLNCPATSLELHALAVKLDPEQTGNIEYSGFERGIHLLVNDKSDDEEDDDEMIPEDFVPPLYVTKAPPLFETLQDPHQATYPRFIIVHLRLATFDLIDKHPGHFDMKVHSHMTIGTLIELIGERGRITSGELNVYTNKECNQEGKLGKYQSLNECGYNGGPFRRPENVKLFYDYVVEYSDCPLLNCDHYFGQEKRPKNPVLTAYL
ncbi:uncharacterized protein LOC100176286 isoform X1 [Ciona intestinalis]